jgi:hypothetical protein
MGKTKEEVEEKKFVGGTHGKKTTEKKTRGRRF